jgi:hypothetical protein
VLNVAVKVPGVGSKPLPVNVPEPATIRLLAVTDVCVREESVRENPPTDQTAPPGGTVGFTAINEVIVTVVKTGTLVKLPLLWETKVGPML